MDMDEVGARIGCPSGEVVVVPSDVTQLYTESPENHKSVTIIETIKADGSSPLRQVSILWTVGYSMMRGDEWITCSPTDYTNNSIVMEYADHLILHSAAGPDMPWKLLFLDGHESHRYKPCRIEARKEPCQALLAPTSPYLLFSLSMLESFSHSLLIP